MSAVRSALARQMLDGYTQDLEDGEAPSEHALLLVIATALVSLAEDNHGMRKY